MKIFFRFKQLINSSLLLLLVTFFSVSIIQIKPVSAKPSGVPPGLFTSMNAPGSSHANEAAVRSRNVKINDFTLNANTLNLNLFEDEQYIAKRRHVRKNDGYGFTWTGDIEGVEDGSVNITVYDGAVAGSVNLPGRLYQISTLKNGNVVIEEIESSLLPVDGDPAVPGMDLVNGDTSGGNTTTTTTTSTQSDIGDVIDLMVLYTPRSRNRYGQAGIESLIINAVAMANDAYSRSNFNPRLNLVHMQEINYSETGNMTDALYAITDKTDGIIDNVHQLRDQYGADIVSLIDEDSNYCGIAWIMTSTYLNYFESYAFNVTYSSCISNHSMTHEVGHNEGNAHDRDNGSEGAYPYSFGYRNPAAHFRTIMSYSCSDIGGSCPRVAQISNPDVYYNGYPTGIDYNTDPNNSADNIRSMNNTFSIVSNWRSSVSTATAPDAPTNLSSSNVTESSVDLSWNDASDNEDGFYVERSPNSTNWTQIATLGVNTTSYQDNGLSTDSTYYYRVQAFNGVGNSGYSNTISVSTAPAPQPTNNPPSFFNDPFSGPDAQAGSAYSADISGSAYDPDGDTISYSKLSGPSWLSVSPGGALSGTPSDSNVGLNSFQIEVSDSSGLTDTATLNINVDSRVQAQNSMHVGDLDYQSSVNKNRWMADVTVSVHDSNENPVSGVLVTGDMSTKGRSPDCTTGSNGKCTVTLNGSGKDNSITFTVNDLSVSGYVYSPADNHDPDGDSDGTTIITYQP